MKKIAILCSEYPALSHTFISREIAVLEAEGFEILTASVNPTRNREKMGAFDQARADTTFVFKQAGIGHILGQWLAHALRPVSYFRAWGLAARLAWFDGPKDLGKAIAYFVQAALLHGWARDKGLKHVHVHFANSAATVAMIACAFGDLEFSLSVHGPDEFFDVERNNLRQKIQAAVFVRCISHFCRSQLMRISPADQWSKFHLVRCGLHAAEFTTRAVRTGPLKSIVCVGRLCPAKGQDLLLDMARTLKSRGKEFHLLLLGGGENLESIKAKVAAWDLAKEVTVAGPVGHDRVKQALAEADIFVLPSFAEGIPVALMEAMAAGIPVVTTTIAGIPELVEHGKTGFVTPASDLDALTETISRLLDGHPALPAIIPAAAAKVAAEYESARNTAQLARIFESLEEK